MTMNSTDKYNQIITTFLANWTIVLLWYKVKKLMAKAIIICAVSNWSKNFLLMEQAGVQNSCFHISLIIVAIIITIDHAAAAAAKLLQLCPTLCDPRDGSPPGSPVPGILQARTLEWVAISFSNAWKWKGKVKSLNRVWLFTTPWTAAHQAPRSMGFSRQEYWSGVPSPSLIENALNNKYGLW